MRILKLIPKGNQSGAWLAHFLTPKLNELKKIAAFLRVQPLSETLTVKILVIFPQHPKRDQNLKFTPLSETTSTPTFFYIPVSPPPPISPAGLTGFNSGRSGGIMDYTGIARLKAEIGCLKSLTADTL